MNHPRHRDNLDLNRTRFFPSGSAASGSAILPPRQRSRTAGPRPATEAALLLRGAVARGGALLWVLGLSLAAPAPTLAEDAPSRVWLLPVRAAVQIYDCEQLLCGLTVLKGLAPAGQDRWTGGSLYNPDDGRTYHFSGVLKSPDIFVARVYLGAPLFGRTLTWKPVAELTADGGLLRRGCVKRATNFRSTSKADDRCNQSPAWVLGPARGAQC